MKDKAYKWYYKSWKENAMRHTKQDKTKTKGIKTHLNEVLTMHATNFNVQYGQ